MKYFDVFNGDADGICALQQLRLAQPRDSELVTGVKRHIELLKTIQVEPGDQITVLDISLDKNYQAVEAALAAGAKIDYFDHHYAGDIIRHPRFYPHINMEAETCTSIIVSEWLNHQHLAWAVVGAFGDNFSRLAENKALQLRLSRKQIAELRKLGLVLNYNSYGDSLNDLFFHPAELFQRVNPYHDPLDFLHEDDAFNTLWEGYENDMAQAKTLTPHQTTATGCIFVLPNQAWSRRVNGVFANDLAERSPDIAHALLVENSDGFSVSVRAPLNRRSGADELCRQFTSGGGRRAAAGINHLPNADFSRFINAFERVFKNEKAAP